MKTIKRIITVVLIIFCSCLVYNVQAQITAEQEAAAQRVSLAYHQDATKSAYIFEGTVTHQKIYYGKTQAVYTCIMQISKIYKGGLQLKLGSIKVVTWQNVVYNGMLIHEEDGGRLTETSKGGTYIMFCRPANTSWLVDSTVTDNSMTLTIWGMDEVVIVYPANDSVSWYGTPQFKTTEDIDAFFQENGLTIQEQVAPADSTMKK